MRNKSSIIDLAGKRFERLVVISLARKGNSRGEWYWLCQCDCGAKKEVLGRSLRQGHARSCGCLHKDVISKDKVGMRFGRLLVVSRTERQSNYNGSYYWLCKCECGNTKEVRTGDLTSGMVRSCGCLLIETARKLLLKHGLYADRHYRNAYGRQYKQKKRIHDTSWTPFLSWLLFQFNSRCAVCGMAQEDHLEKYNESLHVDHVRPLSKGFGLRPGNAVLLCKFHNIAKRDKDVEQLSAEWQQSILKSAEAFRLAVVGGF